MMTDLFIGNHPAIFWRCLAGLTEEQWQLAIEAAAPVLQLPEQAHGIDGLHEAVLGEGQFGNGHWVLSPIKRSYYALKPLLPRVLIRNVRRLYAAQARANFPLGWPIEDRYVRFQWDVMRHLLGITEQSELAFIHFWPEGRRFALVLTHDVETAQGQAHIRRVADMEAGLGFRSSFNVVPERYRLDHELLKELRERGFEVGVHGLKHDGRLFSSLEEFSRRAERINSYLRELNAVGFRAPLTHRQPQWMQALDIEYDLSFFYTHPFEPISV